MATHIKRTDNSTTYTYVCVKEEKRKDMTRQKTGTD
jgi:hypothetical protein